MGIETRLLRKLQFGDRLSQIPEEAGQERQHSEERHYRAVSVPNSLSHTWPFRSRLSHALGKQNSTTFLQKSGMSLRHAASKPAKLES